MPIVEHGANPNVQNNMGRTALFGRANPNLKTIENQIACLHLICNNCRHRGHVDEPGKKNDLILLNMLLENGANPMIAD